MEVGAPRAFNPGGMTSLELGLIAVPKMEGRGGGLIKPVPIKALKALSV